MPEIVKYADTGTKCYAVVRLKNDDACLIRMNRKGVLVKKGVICVRKLFTMQDGTPLTDFVAELQSMFPSTEPPLPNDMENPVVRAFTNTALYADSAEALGMILDEALAMSRMGSGALA